jgi:hypothetical protein
MNDDPLTPAEARATELLAGLREAESPQHTDLAASVTHSARWQRQVRHALVSIGDAAGGVAGGLAHLVRGRR